MMVVQEVIGIVKIIDNVTLMKDRVIEMVVVWVALVAVLAALAAVWDMTVRIVKKLFPVVNLKLILIVI